MSAEDILARQKEFLFPCVANYYEEPVVITKAKGTYVEDVRGTKYLDFLEEFSQYPWGIVRTRL